MTGPIAFSGRPSSSSSVPSSSCLSASPSCPASTGLAARTSLAGRRLYLAVDCGGTKAAAAISISSATAGGPPVFLSRGHGGPANYTDVGLWRFLRSVRQAVERALDNSGIEWRSEAHMAKASARRNAEDAAECHSTCSSSPSGSPQSTTSSLDDSDHASSSTSPSSRVPSFTFPPIFHAAWLGVAGVDSPQNIAVLSPHLAQMLSIPWPSSRLIVANDTSLLASPVMESGGSDEDVREGVVAIAGTGSIVMSFRSRKQQSKEGDKGGRKGNTIPEAVGRVGGFGWLLGDEAGGFRVGKQAIRAILDQADQEKLELEDQAEEEDEDDDSEEQQKCRSDGVAADSTSIGAPLLDLPAEATSVDVRHLLRDRVLAEWNLDSVGELLDAVYADSPGTPEQRLRASHQLSVTSSQSSCQPATSQEGSTGKVPPSLLSRESMRHLLEVPELTSSTEDASHSSNSYSYPATPTTDTPLVVDVEGLTESFAAPSALTLMMEGHKTSLAYAEISNDVCPKDTDVEALEPPQPRPTSRSSSHKSSSSTMGARKQRLAGLAPLVFDLAFTQGDEMSLQILRGEIRELAFQISRLLAKPPKRRTGAKNGGLGVSSQKDKETLVQPHRSVLCLGGSLLGVPGYRQMLVDELKSRGCEFQEVVHVEDVAKRGCEALAKGWEGEGAEAHV